MGILALTLSACGSGGGDKAGAAAKFKALSATLINCTVSGGLGGLGPDLAHLYPAGCITTFGAGLPSIPSVDGPTDNLVQRLEQECNAYPQSSTSDQIAQTIKDLTVALGLPTPTPDTSSTT